MDHLMGTHSPTGFVRVVSGTTNTVDTGSRAYFGGELTVDVISSFFGWEAGPSVLSLNRSEKPKSRPRLQRRERYRR
jgi:hypothetical protein